MGEEEFTCQDCGHHEYIEYEANAEAISNTQYECTNCYHIQESLSGMREEE